MYIKESEKRMRSKKLIEYEDEKVLCEMESRMEKGVLCDMELEMELFIGKRSEVERILKVKIDKEWEDEIGKVMLYMRCEEKIEVYVISGYDIMKEIGKGIDKEMKE